MKLLYSAGTDTGIHNIHTNPREGRKNTALRNKPQSNLRERNEGGESQSVWARVFVWLWSVRDVRTVEEGFFPESSAAATCWPGAVTSDPSAESWSCAALYTGGQSGERDRHILHLLLSNRDF